MILKISKYLDIHPSVIAPEYSEFLDFLKVEDSKNNKIETETAKEDCVEEDNNFSLDMSYLINIGNNLSISNKELAISTRELATTTKESNNAMIEFARLIILKEK